MSEFIGTKINIPGARGHGVLRYYGPINGKNGVFGGVELIGPLAAARGKNSGDVDGVSYFEVQHPMSGIFFPFERLKSVNPHLREARSASSTPTSRSEVSYTPSPKDRSVSGSGSISRSNYAPHSTQTTPVTLMLPKRISRMTQSIDEKLSDSTAKDEAIEEQNRLKAELAELRYNYEQSKKEHAKNLGILNELRATVNEVQPLIEVYENEISEKDKKLSKLKDDFFKAREEWRESLDMMVSSQQETESYYESEVIELQVEIERLRQNIVTKSEQAVEVNGSDSNQEMIQKLIEEKTDLKNLLDTTIESKEQDIKSYETKIGILEEQSKNQLQLMEELKRDLDAERQLTSSLKDELEHIKVQESNGNKSDNDSQQDKDIDVLAEGVDAFKLEDTNKALQRENESLKKELSGAKAVEAEVIILRRELEHVMDTESEIDNLKRELKIRPSFKELSELQSSLEILETLHKTEKEGLIQQIERLERQKRELKERLADVESDQHSLQLPSPTIRDYIVESNERIDTNDPIRTDLPVYTPTQPIDPSAGREDWCGLCEREGHNSLNCPYENDIF